MNAVTININAVIKPALYKSMPPREQNERLQSYLFRGDADEVRQSYPSKGSRAPHQYPRARTGIADSRAVVCNFRVFFKDGTLNHSGTKSALECAFTV